MAVVIAKLGPAFQDPPGAWDGLMTVGFGVLLITILAAGLVILVAGLTAGGTAPDR